MAACTHNVMLMCYALAGLAAYGNASETFQESHCAVSTVETASKGKIPNGPEKMLMSVNSFFFYSGSSLDVSTKAPSEWTTHRLGNE